MCWHATWLVTISNRYRHTLRERDQGGKQWQNQRTGRLDVQRLHERTMVVAASQKQGNETARYPKLDDMKIEELTQKFLVNSNRRNLKRARDDE